VAVGHRGSVEISRNRLRSFLAVADHLHFGRAAQQLHVSQQALSSAIRRLEDDLGVPLFARDTRHVRLTAAGEMLAKEAPTVLGDIDRLMAQVRSAGRDDTAPLHLSVGTGAESARFLTGVVDAIRVEHPDLAVVTRQTFGNQLAGLRTGDTHVALEYLPFHDDDLSGLQSLIVAQESVAVYVAAGHRLAGRTSVMVDELLDEIWLEVPEGGFLPAWVDFWTLRPQRRAAGRGRTLEVPIGSYEDVAAAVARGDAVALAPCSGITYYPGRDIVAVPVSDAPPARTALLWRAEDVSRQVRIFLQAARQTTATAR
jgi:DNA-binding transcriptional LysR family regulator